MHLNLVQPVRSDVRFKHIYRGLELSDMIDVSSLDCRWSLKLNFNRRTRAPENISRDTDDVFESRGCALLHLIPQPPARLDQL